MKPLVLFLFSSDIHDYGWSYQHAQAKLTVQAKYRDQIDVIEGYLPDDSPLSDKEKQAYVANLLSQGVNLVFGCSFGHQFVFQAIAKDFPLVKSFLTAGGYLHDPPVLSTFFGRMYQARFLHGILAGHVTKAEKVCFIAAFQLPEVICGINAFTIGLREINPRATVHVRWTGTWFQPDLEKYAAETALKNDGCDIITMHVNSLETIAAAKRLGKFALGYHSDVAGFFSDTVLSSAVWNWVPMASYFVDKLLHNNLNSTESYFTGLDVGTVDIHWGTDIVSYLIPEAQKALIQIYRQALLAGNDTVFCGARAGLEFGLCLSDDYLLSSTELLPGVVQVLGDTFMTLPTLVGAVPYSWGSAYGIVFIVVGLSSWTTVSLMQMTVDQKTSWQPRLALLLLCATNVGITVWVGSAIPISTLSFELKSEPAVLGVRLARFFGSLFLCIVLGFFSLLLASNCPDAGVTKNDVEQPKDKSESVGLLEKEKKSGKGPIFFLW